MKPNLLLFVLLFMTACNTNTGYKNISVDQLRSATETNRVILDVRQPEEFSQGHVPGAKLIPVGELESQLQQVPSGVPVYVICRSGNRSKTASDILVRNGWTDVSNVQGGTLAWQAAGYPLE